MEPGEVFVRAGVNYETVLHRETYLRPDKNSIKMEC